MGKVSSLDLSINPGYYIYNNQSYFSKIDLYNAILEAKDPFPHMTFWFHDDVFSKIDWSIEPAHTLNELYRIRAQQLRDKYDYLILLYSGGADSTQVLDTFISNNIFLDEVRTDYPVKMLETLAPVPNPSHPYGIIYEYTFAALPGLNRLKQKNLKTKITIGDNTNFFKNASSDKKLLEKSIESFITTIPYQSIRMIDQIEQVEKYVETNKLKNVGVIYAADKPALNLVDDELFAHFTDIGCAAPGVHWIKNSNVSRVQFYWSRDLPLIPIKQGHMIKKLIESNELVYKSANGWGSFNKNLKEKNIIKCLIYSAWDKTIYQKQVKHEDHEVLNYFGTTEALTQLDSYVRSTMLKHTHPWLGNKNKHIVQSRYYKIGNIQRQ